MGLTFTRATEAVVGELPKSREYNKLAKAFNERILSGVADGAWRIVWEALGMVRQPRNPRIISMSPPIYVWPPQDEWLKVYGLIEPQRQPGLYWPTAPPGEQEGISLSWPLGAFVYGNTSPTEEYDPNRDLLAEDARGDQVPLRLGNGALPGSLSEFWLLAKLQRGGVDLDVGVQAAPVLTASQEHYKVGYHGISPMLKTYGGYFPTRTEIGNCGDGFPENGTPHTPKYQVFFSRLANGALTGERVYYSGFCPQDSPGSEVADAIWGILSTRFSYKVFRWDGEVDTLTAAEWIEGPYTGGGLLQHGKGEQVEQSLNNLLVSYRGSETQRASPSFRITKVGFNYEGFFRRQFSLAPAKGVLSGQEIVVEYPQWRTDEELGAGAFIQRTGDGAGQRHQVSAGFVAAGIYAQGLNLAGPVTIEMTARNSVEDLNRVRVAEFTLTPGDNPLGVADAGEYIRYFDEIPLAPNGGLPILEFRVVNELTLKEGGWVLVEVAELQDYKPWVNDGFLVLRLGSTAGGGSFGDADGLDNHGSVFEESKALSDAYLRYGVIYNSRAPGLPSQNSLDGGAAIVDNPVYEATRQLVIGNVRLANRERLLGYEVVDGKSVLHFDRFPLLENSQLDLFQGIGPSLDAVESGKVDNGIEYEVRGGTGIVYNGEAVATGQQFTGVSGVKTFEATGGEEVWEVEGIRRVAPEGGFTKRWCCFFTWNVYHTSESSIWKPDNYGDALVTLTQRAHLGSREIKGNPGLLSHFSFGQKPVYVSEAPSGYIYARGTHHWPITQYSQQPDFDDAVRWYKSCQVYAAPYEVESVTEYEAGSERRVKVTLAGRLQTREGAPANVANNPASWGAELALHEYRTDENGVMWYLYHQATGINCPRSVIGDAAPGLNDVWGIPDDPFGGCYPRCWFVRLVPEAHADKPVDNDTVQATVDARMLVDGFVQMEFFLRAMAEGYVDEESTKRLQDCTSETSNLYDYTFENLMVEANGTRWLPILPLALRPDVPKGHSILPNTGLYAEVFNSYVRSVNRLTKARLDLPLVPEFRVIERFQTIEVTPDESSTPPSGGCAGDTELAPGDFALIGAPALSGGSTIVQPWSEGVAFGAASTAEFHRDFQDFFAFWCNGGLKWAVDLRSQTVEYRIQDGALALHAVPAALRQLLAEGSFGLLGELSTVRTYYVRDDADGEFARCCISQDCTSFADMNGSQGPTTLKVREVREEETECKMLPPSGQFHAPAASGLLWVWRCGLSAAFQQVSNSTAIAGVGFTMKHPTAGRNLFLHVPTA